MSIQVKNIEKSFGDRVILDNISLHLGISDRAGLIGPNGCGKTTLLKIITGQEDFDSGRIEVPRDNFTIGYLEQFADIRDGGTLLSESLRGAEKLNRIENRLRTLEELMGETDPNVVQAASNEYSELLIRFESSGGYTFESDVKTILTGLGFRENDWELPAEGLSGGERTRLSLARLLSEKPDFILLDEPTNHLDLPAIEWLESTLKSFKGGYLIVSHDRRFLDSCCPVLYELESGKIRRYTGGYEGYLSQKAEWIERERREFEAQQKEIEQLRKFIARWSKDKIRASMAMSRKKKLDKIESEKIELSHRDKAGMRLRFEESVKSWEEVISVQKLNKGFGSRKLISDLDFSVRSKEHLAIIGKNGSGKTTLLKMMVGEEKQDSGDIWWGESVVHGYFSQRMEELDFDNDVITELVRLGRNISGQDARDLLGKFLFSGDDIEKKVGELSGGEKSKLMFAVLLTRKPNCLILDEPTNHLDLPSREVLEEALEEFDGTLIFVSHDRAFIDRLATHTLELSDSGAQMFIGNYSDMLFRKQEDKFEKEEELKRKRRNEIEEERREKARSKRRDSGTKKTVINTESLLSEIELLEVQIKALEEELNLPENYMDYQKAGKLSEAINLKKDERDILFRKLEELI